MNLWYRSDRSTRTEKLKFRLLVSIGCFSFHQLFNFELVLFIHFCFLVDFLMECFPLGLIISFLYLIIYKFKNSSNQNDKSSVEMNFLLLLLLFLFFYFFFFVGSSRPTRK